MSFNYFTPTGGYLTGPIPTWRPGFRDEEPIYREVLADLGPPGLLAGPGDILIGTVL